MAGTSITPGWYKPPPPVNPGVADFGSPSNYKAAANTQAADYDKIMAQYDAMIKQFASNPSGPRGVEFKSVAPQTANYQQSPDVTRSLGDLSNLSDTGGYSDEDIANLRERAISPTRSIYANAQQNVERNKALSGGYSPNFNAVQAKLARDESAQIGDITTNANAGIAQNVASNRLAASGVYAGAAGSANSAQAAADARNAEIVNQVNQFNSQGATQTGMFNSQTALDNSKFRSGTVLNAIGGKASLYGTSPALTKTFGDQVVQASQLGQGQQQLNNQKLNLIPRFGQY